MAHLPNGFGTWSIMKWSHFICFAQFYHSIGPDRDFDMGTDRNHLSTRGTNYNKTL